eukprot:snap_masked-scaffold_88-processed-gene-0.23-mRNA-1 protein AED:1.00 eAED:1.00 QI:0/-1/0/0/-1/1/1/0/638
MDSHEQEAISKMIMNKIRKSILPEDRDFTFLRWNLNNFNNLLKYLDGLSGLLGQTNHREIHSRLRLDARLESNKERILSGRRKKHEENIRRQMEENDDIDLSDEDDSREIKKLKRKIKELKESRGSFQHGNGNYNRRERFDRNRIPEDKKKQVEQFPNKFTKRAQQIEVQEDDKKSKSNSEEDIVFNVDTEDDVFSQGTSCTSFVSNMVETSPEDEEFSKVLKVKTQIDPLQYSVKGEDEKMIPIKAMLDSGVDYTCAGTSFRKYLRDFKQSSISNVFTASREKLKVSGTGKVDIFVQPRKMGRGVWLNGINVLLIVSTKWNRILIGANVLRKLEITPEQVLIRKISKMNKKYERVSMSNEDRRHKRYKINMNTLADRNRTPLMKTPGEALIEEAPLFSPCEEAEEGMVSPVTFSENRYTVKDMDRISRKYDRPYEPNRDYLKGLAENTKLGYETKEQILGVVNKQLKLSYKLGIITKEQEEQLIYLFKSNDEIFGTKNSVTQLSLLPPLDICLKEGAQPPLQEHSRLGPKETDFLIDKLQDLHRIGMIEYADNPIAASREFLVPKSGNRFRLVADFRALNNECLTNALCLPEIECKIQCLPSRPRYLMSFDMLSGFDLLRVTPRSSRWFAITTFLGT